MTYTADDEFDMVKRQEDLDAAIAWIRTVGEELVNAGFPAGDRTVQLANLRKLINRYNTVRQLLAIYERGEK